MSTLTFGRVYTNKINFINDGKNTDLATPLTKLFSYNIFFNLWKPNFISKHQLVLQIRNLFYLTNQPGTPATQYYPV